MYSQSSTLTPETVFLRIFLMSIRVLDFGSISGLGIINSLFLTALQSIQENHECLFISLAPSFLEPNRFLGLRCNKEDIK